MLTLVILIIISSTAEATVVRMVEGDGRCSGMPEVFDGGRWKKLNNYFFDYRTVELLCRELDCGDVVSATFGSDFRERLEDVRLFNVECEGKESSLSKCKNLTTSCHPDHLNVSVAVVCSASVRLVDGAGLCSGRLEMKLNQSWTTVCEADFDWQGAEVICRELGCGPPLTLQKAHLHTCSTLARKEQNSSLGNAVEITCSGPDDLRLVAGASRCSGTVMIYSGQWRRVNADRWSMREAAVVCRQLDCGSAVASTVTVSSRDEAGWGLHIACVGSESRVRECTVLYSGQVQFLVGVICSDSVRLVDGAGLCSGRLEVKSRQSWTTVCEADFDRQDAEVVCRELSCGPPLTLQGALFGERQHPFGTKEFQCNGSEKSLLTCSASARRGRSCAPGRRAVGLTCSEPAEARLLDGNSRCAGTLEMFHNGRWRKVGAKRWSMRMANAVCAQLGCGSALAAMKTKSGGDVAEVGVLLFFDVGIRIKWFPQRIRQIEYYAELVCSEVLVKPTISTPRRVYRGQSFTITCSTQPQYPGGSFHLTHLRTNASHTRPAVNHVASFFFPAADDSNQGNYSCVYENRASFQTEGFRDYDPRGFDGWTPGPFVYNFSSSESEPLSITVADFPLTSVITRVVLVPFLFLIICRCICLIFEKCGHHLIRDTSGQERAAAAVQSEKMKLILLQRRAEERQKVEEEEGPVPNPALLPK